MNLDLIPAKCKFRILLCTLCSFCLISCGMRTEPFYIPEEKAEQTIMDLKVQQRDDRVRLSWRINHSERAKRLQDFGVEYKERDYFLIHQKLINLDCIDCESMELPDLKVIIPSDLLIQNGDQVFYYLQFPEKVLKINSFQITHFGPDDEVLSQSKSVRLRRSNVFPKLTAPELKIVQIEDQNQILSFPFGKLVQHKKIKIAEEKLIEKFKDIEKNQKNEEITLQMHSQIGIRSFTLRISWVQLLNQSLTGFTGKGDFFEGREFYRNHLYRSLNGERWPETPINIKSASENYFLDLLNMQITPIYPPLIVDTHPEIFPSRIPFYIDLSVKYIDTWHYKLRLVDRFGNESEASESVSFDLPNNEIFAKNFVKKILIPHTD